MTEHIVGHVLKAITYYHLLLKVCTCGTIRGCATININYKNKVVCAQIVIHWTTIRICTTNRVNMVYICMYSITDTCPYIYCDCICKNQLFECICMYIRNNYVFV